jgi:hypothetical protein
MRRKKIERRGSLEGEGVVRKGRDRVVVRLEERGREKRFLLAFSKLSICSSSD